MVQKFSTKMGRSPSQNQISLLQSSVNRDHDKYTCAVE